MRRIARIEQMGRAIVDWQLAEKNGFGIALELVAEQPGIVTFLRRGIGYVMQINQHLVGNALAAILAQLPAAQKSHPSHYRGRGWSSRSGSGELHGEFVK